ncbi:MAG: glycosyltransferase family 39 protein [Candidatus Omnitrophica bacterium]|nr:glycosyltransferase family 39 protein [Candidatus Omnitrophota bacterium]
MKNKNLISLLMLLSVSSFLFLFKLGAMPLTDPDETFYAETAKEMLTANDWLTPKIFGEPQFEKPVFYYWTIMASYKFFGVNEFSARLPSALFGILGIIGIYTLGVMLSTPLGGLLSGLIACTSIYYLGLARGCVTDMVLTVFILFSLVFFLKGWSEKKRYYFLLSSASMALAVLTKGPIGLFLPGLILILFITLENKWKDIGRIPFLSGTAVFVVICLPWYLTMIDLHGKVFIGEFFGFHNVTRFLKPEHKIGSSPFFYFPIVLGGILPWTPFLLAGIWRSFFGKEPIIERSGRTLFTIWFLTVFLFFSFSSTKLLTYISPLFPVLAVITGIFWEKFITGKTGGSEEKAFIIPGLVLLVIASIPGFLVGRHIVLAKCPEALASVTLGSAILFSGILLALLFSIFGKRRLSFISLFLGVLVLSLPAFTYIMPIIGASESSAALAGTALRLSGPGEPIGGESDRRRGIAFYTGRVDVPDIHTYGGLIAFFPRKERVWGIVQKKHYEQLAGYMKGQYFEVISSSGKYVLVTNKPLLTSPEETSK